MKCFTINDKKEFLSAVWIFVTFNYLYCDLIGMMDSTLLNQYLKGKVDKLIISERFLFYAGILMEIPIVMILLSKVLPQKANGVVNIIAGSIKTVVMIATLFLGRVTTYYAFFAVIEIATTIFIVVFAAQWLRQKMS